MRNVALVLVFLLLSGCNSGDVDYESYVQANRTLVDGEAMVLVLIRNPAAGQEQPDSATVNFLIRKGESKEEVFRNKHYPTRTYSFVASREDERVIKIEILVKDRGETIFKSTQQFASWAGF